MPVYDQYEVEPTSAYSGSYTDNIIINQPILEGMRPSIGISIGDKISGINNNINLINFSYASRLNFVSGSAGGTSTQNVYSQLKSNELYYDSLVPDILKLNLLDANVPSFGSTIANKSSFGFLRDSTAFNRPAIPTSNMPIIFGPNGSRNITGGVIGSEFVNFNWKERPWSFSSKYKNISRPDGYKYDIAQPFSSTTKSLDDTVIPVTTCTHIGSFYWALPTNSQPDRANPAFFATSGSNVSTMFFEHVNMPAGNDIRNLIYNTSIGDDINGSASPDVYISIGDKSTLAYSYNGIKWFPICSNLTNDKFLDTTTGLSYGQTYAIAYSVTGSWDRHGRYVIVDSRITQTAGGLIIQNVSNKIPSVDNSADWTFYNYNTLRTSIISGLPGAYSSIRFNSIAFNDPYGYMAEADKRFCIVGLANPGTDALIVLANSIASAGAGAMTYIAPPAGVPADSTLNDVTISLTSTATTARWFACGNNGTIIHSSNNTGTTAWTNLSVGGTDNFLTIAARPSTSTSSTIIAAGTNGVAYRSTKSNVPVIPAFVAIAGLPSSVTWRKVVPVKRTDSNVQWFLIGYAGTSFNPSASDQPLIYYSTDDGITWSEFAVKSTNWSSKFKEWAHDPSGNFGFYSGIASAPIAGSSPVAANQGYKTIPSLLLGGNNMWDNNIFDTNLVLAKISDIETPFSSSQIYTKYIESSPCTYAVNQLRPVSGLLEPDGYYHKNIIPDRTVPYKHFFGFGNSNGITFQFGLTPYGGFEYDGSKFPGTLKIPNAPINNFWDVYDGWEERGPESVKIYGGNIRGWHYGIYNAINTYTKQIYRRNKYGQFRDMLEGRLTTATLIKSEINPYNGRSIPRTLFYPVEISFVSGTTIYNQSRDYVTATNPTYNPYDSGIYDIYYRSGQPFFDRENED